MARGDTRVPAVLRTKDGTTKGLDRRTGSGQRGRDVEEIKVLDYDEV